MSFSKTMSGNTADEIKSAFAEDVRIPEPIREYVSNGIDALVSQYGPDVKIDVVASGHLHNGDAGNDETTSATIVVSKAPPVPVG